MYRGANGAVLGLLGSNERRATATTYRFFSKDRDVFYNGDGPRRDFTVSIAGDQERVMSITSGADVPPLISGQYIVVNRNSGKVMEVAGGSTTDGANIQQNTYTGGRISIGTSPRFTGPRSRWAIARRHKLAAG